MTHKKDLQNTLAKGRADEVIKALLAATEQNGQKDLHQTLVVLSARFNRNERNQMLGILSESEYRVENNRIVSALIHAIEEWEEPTPNAEKPQTPILNTPNPPSIDEKKIEKQVIFDAEEGTETFPPILHQYEHGYALLIGIAYAHWEGGGFLPGTLNDVKDLFHHFTDRQTAAYKPENVIQLTEKQATTANIFAALHALAAKANQDTDATVLVYFSGHGETDGTHHFLVPYDFDIERWRKHKTFDPQTVVLSKDFTRALDQIQAKKSLIVLDCCHAANMPADKSLNTNPSFFKHFLTDLDHSDLTEKSLGGQITQGKGRVILTSCQGEEKSLDLGSNGLFTQVLLEALKGVDNLKKDGWVRLIDLIDYVPKNVSARATARGKKQNPEFKRIENLGAEDFLVCAYDIGKVRGGVETAPVEKVLAIGKPSTIRKLEEVLGYELHQIFILDDIFEGKNSKSYFLNEKDKVVGLNLFSCNIEDISFLSDFPNLTSLNLGINQIRDITALSGLNKLICLDLNHNRIENYFSLSKLINLRHLNLSHNRIYTGDFLRDLINLNSLNLHWVEINDFSFLSHLPNLTHLDIGTNRVSDISFLQGLSYLTSLNLSSNQIQDISFLQGLTSLTSLNLSNNQIQDISFISNMKNLKYLDLVYNHISDLTPLLKIDKLEFVNLEGNEKVERDFPKVTFEVGWGAIKDYILNQRELVTFNKVKILLLGNTNIGKSTLLEFLKTGEVIKKDSTHGIQYEKISLNGSDIEFHVWDFGGQDYFHATHKLFFSANALNIILWGKDEARKDRSEVETCFEKDYWLRIVEQLNTEEAKVLLVENKTDLNTPKYKATPINTHELQNKFSKLEIETEHICLLEQKRLEGLHDMIISCSSNLINKHPGFYNTFWNRIVYLNTAVVNIADINERPNTHNVKAAMRVFHNMGMLLYFEEIIPEKVFVKPQILLELLYEKILGRDKAFKISKQEINEAVKGNELGLRTEEVIRLLEHFDLVFEIPSEKEVYFISQYLPEMDLHFALRLEEDFKYITTRIVADNYLMSLAMLKIFANYGRFVQRNNQAAYFFWKDGIVIDKGGQQLKIVFERNTHRIHLFIDKNVSNFTLQREILLFILGIPEQDRRKSLDISRFDSGISDNFIAYNPYFTVFISPNGDDFCSSANLQAASETKALKVRAENGQLLDLNLFDFYLNNNEHHSVGKTTIIADEPEIIDKIVHLPPIQEMRIIYIEKRFEMLEPLIQQGLALLVTATDTETGALHQKMKPLPNEEGLIEVKKDNGTYYVGLFGNFAVANVECGTMGSITSMGSTLTVSNAINALQPKFVLMVGIAFGIDSKKQNIGDVLVSDKLIPYEIQRVSENTIVWRGSKPEANNNLRNSFKSIKTWKNQLPNGDNATLELCDILSGEKLVDNIDFRDDLLAQFPTAKGGEMEGAGLYAACQDKSLPWILVKAICDFADGQKREGKKEKQALAIEMALRACLAVFNKQYVFEDLGVKVFEEILPVENPAKTPKEENKIHVEGDNNIVITGSYKNNIHIQQGNKVENEKEEGDKSTLITLLENHKIPDLLAEMDKLNISDKFTYNRFKKEYQAGLKGIDLMDWKDRLKVFINGLKL